MASNQTRGDSTVTHGKLYFENTFIKNISPPLQQPPIFADEPSINKNKARYF